MSLVLMEAPSREAATAEAAEAAEGEDEVAVDTVGADTAGADTVAVVVMEEGADTVEEEAEAEVVMVVVAMEEAAEAAEAVVVVSGVVRWGIWRGTALKAEVVTAEVEVGDMEAEVAAPLGTATTVARVGISPETVQTVVVDLLKEPQE